MSRTRLICALDWNVAAAIQMFRAPSDLLGNSPAPPAVHALSVGVAPIPSSPMLNILIPVFIMLVVLGGGHFYLWKRLIRDSDFAPTWRRGLSILMLILVASFPATMFSMRALPREEITGLAFVAFIWLALVSTYFTLLLITDLTFLGFKWSKRRTSSRKPSLNLAGGVVDPDRRRTLHRLIAGGVVATGSGVVAAGIHSALKGFTLKEVEVTLEKLPRAFDGLRIVQLSDVHVGPTIGVEFVQAMVEAANSLQPDVIALTGDFVDGQVEYLSRHTAPLADLQATMGTYFVTGNHEYYSGVDAWIGEFERLGITTLRNRSKRIWRGNESFLIAGVTDYRAGRYGEAPDLSATLARRNPGEEVVLLAHQPRQVSEAQAHDVGLQLSGHTHGGQFWPWNWVIHLIEPVVAGLAQFGRTQIYVNSGTGYWGPPVRIGTESEITLVTLRSTTA